MTGPDDRRRGLTPFDGGVKNSGKDPHPHAALVDKKGGGGDKNFKLAGVGEDPSPPFCVRVWNLVKNLGTPPSNPVTKPMALRDGSGVTARRDGHINVGAQRGDMTRGPEEFVGSEPRLSDPPDVRSRKQSSAESSVGGEGPPAPRTCVGCGYCCAQAPCHFSMDKYCCAHPCPALYWNGERYRCADVAVLPLRDCCAIGAGCCSAMNSWRGSKIQRRPEIENPLPHHKRVESSHDL